MNHALIFRVCAVVGCMLLIPMLGLGYGNIGWLFSLPLIAPLPGMLLNHRYTYAWASMLLIFYLGWLASEVAAPQQLPWELHVALGASLAGFIGCIMYVRLSRPAIPGD